MSTAPATALDRARKKAYFRLLPILFVCYVIAYVDRANVGFVKLTMQKDLAGFDDKVFGFAMGTCFFVGYLLLEIPGTLMVERWSARKWICRIMVSWGLVAALTAFVRRPLAGLRKPLRDPGRRTPSSTSFTPSGSCWDWPRRDSSPG